MNERDLQYLQFWDWFAKQSERLRRIRSTDAPEYAEIESHVTKFSSSIDFEVGGTSQPGELELIFTSHGTREVFPEIDRLVELAPRLIGWRIYALKPSLLEEFDITFEGCRISVADLWIRPVSGDIRKPAAAWEIAVLPRGALRDIRAESGAMIAIETFLGEREFASRFYDWSFVPLPANPAEEGFFSLLEMASILALRRVQ